MHQREFSQIFASVRLWVPIAWIGAMAYFLFDRWNLIRAFALGDTDDNMRMAQVRALLAGQDWFDLRQYRLDPPFGADIHWSRLVDLPIAGLMLLLRPFIGGRYSEQVAVTLAPMLPMGIAILAIALIARRIIAPKSLLVALLILACAHSTRGMWVPLRIDHHGWQLAFLSLVLLGLTDPDKRRGGTIVGIGSAASLTIGLELLIYLAAAGAAIGLLWIRDGDGRRLAAYGAALGGGCAIGFLLFASYTNRAPVCDALSPVWLSTMVLAGGVCVLLAATRPPGRLLRTVTGILAGIIVAAAFAWFWRDCLGRLEGVSPRAQELWLNNVREARPIYRQSANTIATFVALPVLGLVGYGVMLWRNRREPDHVAAWAPAALLAATSTALLLWQTRAGPAANLLAVPGATGMAWLLMMKVHRGRFAVVRVLATALGFVVISGLGVQFVTAKVVEKKDDNARSKAVGRANRLCPTMAALRPIALLPKGYVLTFVDLGPRLIAVTHHDAVAGPYHRNYRAIVDVMETFGGSAERAREMIARRHIDYVLVCPNMSESTNYQARSPRGFYVQLAKGKSPAWLEPIPLPKDSPYRIWRVKRESLRESHPR